MILARKGTIFLISAKYNLYKKGRINRNSKIDDFKRTMEMERIYRI